MEAAIVFDMDGVLVDTEPLKFRAHRKAVEARGGELGPDRYRRGMGHPHDDVIRFFLSGAGLPSGPEAVQAYEERFRAAYRELLVRELAPTDGAEELLDACMRQDRQLALVTSSDPSMVEIVLERLEAAPRFAAVVTAADVDAGKPAPDPYRRARTALGPAGDRAVAVEDTEAGVASATAAGLPVVAVRHAFNGRHDFGRAAAVVDSLAPAAAFLDRLDRLAGGIGPAPGERPAAGDRSGDDDGPAAGDGRGPGDGETAGGGPGRAGG